MFGVGFYQGYRQADERIRTRRAKVNQAFQQWKADNPYATAADFQNAVRAIGGGDFTVATALPGQQAIQRMAADNQRKKQEAEQAKQFEAMERKLRYQNSLMSTVGQAAKLMGDKANPEAIAAQLGVPVEQVKPAFDNFRAQTEKAEAERQRALANEGLTIMNNFLDQGLRAGLRGEELSGFAQSGYNEWAKINGVTTSAGTLGGAPSSEQAALNSSMDRALQLSEAAEKTDAANAYNALIQQASTPAIQAQLREDPSAAIDSLLAGSQLELSDNVLALTRTKLEAGLKQMAEDLKAQDVSAATNALTSIFDAERESDPNAILDPDAAMERAKAEARRQGHSQSAVDEAMSKVSGNALDQMELEYDAKYQSDPQVVFAEAQRTKFERAANIVTGMVGNRNERGLSIIGDQLYSISEGEAQIITRALSQLAYYDDAEAMTIAAQMAKFVVDSKEAAGAVPNAAQIIEFINGEREIPLDLYNDYVGDMQEQFAKEVAQEFTSTEDLIAADQATIAEIDAAYELRTKDGKVVIDITAEAIEDTKALGKIKRQAALNQIKSALDQELRAAQAHLLAFNSNSMSIANMTGIDPQYRMAFGAQLDRQAYAAAVEGRIADLFARKRNLTSAMAGSYDQAQDNGLNPDRFFTTDGTPVPGVPNQIVGFMNVGGGNRKPGRDVSFSEVLSATEDEQKHYEYSLVDSFTANAADLSEKIPNIYAAIVNGGVPDGRVTRAIARALEAYDYFHANAPKGRSNQSTINRYNQLLDELMPNLPDAAKAGAGYLGGQARDNHAMQFALTWFAQSLEGMDPDTALALSREFTAILTGMTTDAITPSSRALGNDSDITGFDLPRLRESLR